VAAPFVEGQLRKKKLAVEIQTECAHCGRAWHVTIGSALRWQVRERDAQPLVFSPTVDWSRFRKPVIIHDY
jgi:hypothetical protein